MQTIYNLFFLQAGKARSSAEAEKKGMVCLKRFRRLGRFVVAQFARLVARAIVYRYGNSYNMPTLLQACESSLTYGEIQFHSFATAISKIRLISMACSDFFPRLLYMKKLTSSQTIDKSMAVFKLEKRYFMILERAPGKRCAPASTLFPLPLRTRIYPSDFRI